MKNIVKKSWRDVTINEFFKLKNNLSEFENEYEKEIYLISFVNNIPEEEVYNISISKLNELKDSLKFLEKFELSKDVKFSKLTINNSKYKIETDLQKFTVAQYIDFQTFFPKKNSKENYIGNILSCFIIPKGHKYNDGYDIAELINEINNTVDILTANEIIFFFLKKFLISIKVLERYLNYQMKIMKKVSSKKNKATLEKIMKQWEEIQKNTLNGLPLSIMSPS